MSSVGVCSDGVSRTGTFLTIHCQLERLKTEGVVDFFQAIKSARLHRPGLVTNIVSKPHNNIEKDRHQNLSR